MPSRAPSSLVRWARCLRTAVIRLLRDSDDVLGPAQQLDLAGALRTVTCNPARQGPAPGRDIAMEWRGQRFAVYTAGRRA